MKSWNVFIDTSIFISSNFNFKSKIFSSLRSLCNSGHVTMIITDITIEEIKANMLKSVAEAESIIKKVSSKARVLRNLEEDSYKFLFEKFDKEKIFNILKAQITTFIQECNVGIIKATEISSKKIFHDYFQCQPPFGEGKKKNEFPDAFVIAAICEWCEANSVKANIVSEDPDFREAVVKIDCLEYFPSLSKLIEAILTDENILINIIHDQMKRHSEMIFEAISDQVKEYEMLVEDADPDAEAFVDDVSDLELSEESVIQFAENIATIVANAHAHLSIDVNCYNPDSWYKDSDDKSIHYRDKIEDIFEREMDFEVEFDIQFDENNIDEFQIIRVVVNNGNLLSFYLDEDTQSFYK